MDYIEKRWEERMKEIVNRLEELIGWTKEEIEKLKERFIEKTELSSINDNISGSLFSDKSDRESSIGGNRF